jgi:2-polyprenyl-3-methyl-5-hydroxy-6-metoxy-1,4-benzoquinol methylase
MGLKERANKGLHPFLFNVIQSSGWFNPHHSLLDIGCGTGAWLSRFPDAKKRLGLDLDTVQFGAEGASAIALNIDTYDGASWGAFELITAFEIIEHLENPGQLFRCVDANLAGNGHFLLSTPNIHARAARIAYLLKGRLPHFDNKSDATHIYPLYIENIKRILPRYRLELVATYAFPEKGNRIYSPSVMILSKLASLFVPEPLPGDNLILHIRRKGGGKG